MIRHFWLSLLCAFLTFYPDTFTETYTEYIHSIIIIVIVVII